MNDFYEKSKSDWLHKGILSNMIGWVRANYEPIETSSLPCN